jgi:hypothetical protein
MESVSLMRSAEAFRRRNDVHRLYFEFTSRVKLAKDAGFAFFKVPIIFRLRFPMRYWYCNRRVDAQTHRLYVVRNVVRRIRIHTHTSLIPRSFPKFIDGVRRTIRVRVRQLGTGQRRSV